MIKKIILITFCISNSLFGQSEIEELNQIKQFLPYTIKAIQEDEKKELNQRTAGIFEKPWLVKKINTEIAQDILSSVVENKRFNIEKDYNEKWSVDFYSKINPNSYIKDVYNSNRLLSNVFVELSNIQFYDYNDMSIIDNIERNIKVNQSTKLNFHTGSIQSNFPITNDYYNKASGSLQMSLMEYQEISFVILKKDDVNKNFKLGNKKGFKLLKIDNNKAYIYLPYPIDNIIITSTNDKNEKYGEHAEMILPEKVFNYAIGNDVNEKSTEELIEQLTVEDFEKKSQILMYQTNGTIENLYIYLKINPKVLASKTIKIKL